MSSPPTMTRATYLELIEALGELDRAFRGPTANSANARLWVEAMWKYYGVDELAKQWPTMDDVPEGVDLFSQYEVAGKDKAPTGGRG